MNNRYDYESRYVDGAAEEYGFRTGVFALADALARAGVDDTAIDAVLEAEFNFFPEGRTND